jgi:hypothetical protein
MRDPLGFFWKVQDGRFVKYHKEGGQIVEVHKTDAMPPAGRHVSARCDCGGDVYGLPGFQLCAKCAAEVRV